MKRQILTLLCVASLLGANAQWRRNVTPADTLRSIVTNNDGSTSFRIYAPKAESVELGGDFSFYKAQFTKDAEGIWTAVVPNVATDAYRYHFIVDGVRVIDPRYRLYSEITPVAMITNGKDIFWAQRDVPHGPVSQLSYKSSTTGTTRSMHIWMPAGKAAQEPLPVFYLIHGGGDNDASWTSVGCAGNILDNLYAEGKISPMIVVMPHGGMDTEKFVDELVVDVMPRVAEQYRIKTGPKNTALAGLSMGGLETLNCFMAHPNFFGYINVMSSGWFRSTEADRRVKTERLRKIAPTLSSTAKVLRFTMGGKDDIAYENCQQMLRCFDEAGIKYEYGNTPGGHSWHVWHYDLRDFAPRLFK